MEPVMTIEDIMKILPHRYPFLLVDRVIEKNGTDTLVAIKNVTMNEEFFNGHFPGKPVMPDHQFDEGKTFLDCFHDVLLERVNWGGCRGGWHIKSFH